MGKFEYAHGGTLFLDEIESASLNLQVKVLRALQERVIERVGSNESISIDLRVIAATKADLKEASDRNEFREDLYYRLDVARIELPPLRDRIEDIPLLFQHFLLRASVRYGAEAPPVPAEVIRQLSSREWEGNVRELRNVAHRYVLNGGLDRADSTEEPKTLSGQVEAFERSLIERELADHQGSIKDTYASLGLSRKSLYEKMKKYEIDRQEFREKNGIED
jgi:two-component system C4-dicarboxylate transport response regulator DctD